MNVFVRIFPDSLREGLNRLLKIMNLTAVCVLLGCFYLSAASYSQTITLEARRAALTEAFKAINDQTEYKVVYNVRFLNDAQPVDISAKQMPLNEFLTEVLDDQALTFSIHEKTILIGRGERKSPSALRSDKAVAPQERIVSGTVTDTTGAPLPGVSVTVKDSPAGGTTDMDGNYRISIPSEATTLVFAMVGFTTLERVLDNRQVIDVTMTVSVSDLEEVVVVGYGTQKKVNVTGSVSSISSKEIENRPITNSSQALQGVTGIYVNQAGGQPGKDGATIRIRGQGTFNNNNPLVLVDGIEFSLSDVNPNDIESISVLKDAASASIYGNRAANGVILVTTKSGSTGETRINYNNYIGIQAATYLPETVKDPVRFMELRNQAGYNAGRTQAFYPEDAIEEYRNGTDPYIYPRNDWIDIMFKNAFIQEHNLRVSGGSEKLSFSVSGGYLDQEGVLMGTDGDRLSVRSSLNYKYKDWLTLQTDLSFNQRNSSEPATTAGTMMEMIFKAQGFHPAYLEDGRYADTWIRSPGHNVYRNPMVWANEGFLNTKRLNGILNFSAEVALPLGFTYLAKVGVSKLSTFENRFVPDIYMYQVKTEAEQRVDYYTPNKNRHVYNNNAEELNTTFYNTLNYSNTIGGKHNLNVLLGASYEKFEDRFFNALIEGFLGNSLTELNAGSVNPEVNGTSNKNVLIGTFGRLNYDYDNKYLFEINFRYDGSSRFAEGNQWGFFPSLSLGWRLDQERFLEPVEWISALKLRGSYGLLGNQAIPNFSYINLIETGREYLFGGSVNSGVAVESFRDPGITWETTRITNFGMDASLFNNRLDITLDVYDKRTDDILRPVVLPAQVGNLGGPIKNIGSVKNTGYDLSIVHRNTFGRLEYGINAGLNYNVNEVTDLNGEIIYGQDKFITREGYPIDSYFILESNGLFQTEAEIESSPFQNITTRPGYIRYVDQNDDDVINSDDRKITGSVLPEYTYSFGLDLNYGNFSLNAFFQGVQGVDTYPERIIATPFWFATSVTERWANESWTPDRPNAALPILTAYEDSQNDNFLKSDYWLLDASYLRLKNIQLGYTLPRELVGRLGLQRCLIFINGQNLLTFSKMKDFDPERHVRQANYYEYPSVKMYTAGINVTF